MGLDLTFKEVRPLRCPHCGLEVKTEIKDCVYTEGRGWYPLLESLGYYVPFEKRTDETDWYGKDMILTYEQVDEVWWYVSKHPELYYSESVLGLIVRAKMVKNKVAINADW